MGRARQGATPDENYLNEHQSVLEAFAPVQRAALLLRAIPPD